jgi:hypothetical protein
MDFGKVWLHVVVWCGVKTVENEVEGKYVQRTEEDLPGQR